MGRKNRLKRERRRAKAQYDRVDFLGGSMELEGSRITTTLSGDAEELDAVREQIARWSESAPSDINARVEQLSAAIASRPTASLLAQLAAITKLANPETYKEYETEHLGIELEYATWLSLQRPEPNKNNTWINGPELQAIADELKDLSRCVLLYHTVAPGKLSGTLDLLSRKTRTHEIGIRNPGYPHHLMGLLHKLFCRFESNLLRIIGFSIDDALIIWRALCDHLNEETSRIVDEGRYLYRFAPSALRRGQLGELVNIGVPTPLGEILLTLSQREGLDALARYCVGSTWNRFQEAMLVKPQIIADRAGISKEKVANFLKVFALEFGQARIADNWPSRYEPLTQAPLLHMGEESYLIHLAHETLWAIRPNLEQKLRGAGLRQRYERHRANVTEAEALQLLSSILPGSEPFHNLYYTMSDEDGRPTQYEVDGLMVYDRTLVVVEIKSGVISSPARRGAPSLKEDLDELLGSAREQASRVTKYLKSTDEAIFIMRDNRKVFLRLGDFSRVLEIVVTLDSISAFASDLTEFLEPQASDSFVFRWSVEFLDLRIISELIELGPQLVHYLDCLSRLPSESLDFNDVLDTFGRYFHNGLNFDFELSHPNSTIHLLSHTTEFDDYFHYQMGQRQTPAPKPAMRLDTDTYEALKSLCEDAEPGFVDRACDVLDRWRASMGDVDPSTRG